MINTKKKTFIFNSLVFKENNLNTYNLSDILFFSLFVFFVPFIWCIMRYFIWPDYQKEMLNFAINNSYIIPTEIYNIYSISILIFQYVCPLIGITYLFFKDREFFIKQKIWFLYFYFALIPLLSLILSSLGNEIVSFVGNSIILPFLLYFFLYKENVFRSKIKNWFSKSNYIKSILFLVIAIATYFLANYLFTLITEKITSIKSFNQLILEKELKTNIGKANLFFSAVLTAPIIEEIVFRRLFIDVEVLRFRSNIYSKIIIYIVSCCSFSLFHVLQGGDLEYLIAYMLMPIITSTIYIYTKNETPCIIIHMLSNLISYIILLS